MVTHVVVIFGQPDFVNIYQNLSKWVSELLKEELWGLIELLFGTKNELLMTEIILWEKKNKCRTWIQRVKVQAPHDVTQIVYRSSSVLYLSKSAEFLFKASMSFCNGMPESVMQKRLLPTFSLFFVSCRSPSCSSLL